MLNYKLPSGLQKITSIILTVIIASVAIIGASYALRGYMSKTALKEGPEVKTEEPIDADRLIGGEKDEHGCILMAGYTWCEPKQKCLREWEEPCEQEDIFNLLADLKNSTGINFSGINITEVKWQTKSGEQKTTGKGFDAMGITDEQYQRIDSFLKDKGFSVDLYNVLAGTISGATGYKKDDTVCVVTGAIVGSENAQGQWIASKPSQVDTEVKCAVMEIDETADWQIYENEKYSYSFKYPASCLYGPLPGYCKQSPPEERPQECRCYLNGTNPDEVSLGTFTGPKDNLSGASFVVFHSVFVDSYSPPAGTDLVNWLKEKFSYQDIPDEVNAEIDGISAVKVYTPYSGMAYSQEDIYFIMNDKLFKIYMNDVDNKDNRKLYDQIIAAFKLESKEE